MGRDGRHPVGLGVTFGFPVLITAAAEGPNAAQRVSAASMIGYTSLLAGPPVLGLLAEHTGILRALLLGDRAARRRVLHCSCGTGVVVNRVGRSSAGTGIFMTSEAPQV